MPVDLDGRRYEAGPGFTRARECPDCFHTRCGEDCVCNCDAAHAEAEAAHFREKLKQAEEELRALRARVAELERTTPSLEWIDLRPAHEPMREMFALSYEQGRRDALREAIDLCRRTEAGDTNHDWREAAKCCRELIASLAAKDAEEAAIRARRRVREVLEANGTNPERFVSEWCRAQAEYETEEAAR